MKCFNCKSQMTKIMRVSNTQWGKQINGIEEICRNQECWRFKSINKIENWQRFKIIENKIDMGLVYNGKGKTK